MIKQKSLPVILPGLTEDHNLNFPFNRTFFDREFVVSGYEYRDGNEMPMHAQVIQDGGNATTGLVAYRTGVREFQPGMTTYNRNGFGYAYQGSSTWHGYNPAIPNVSSFPNSLNDDAVARATSLMYQKLASLHSPFQGQVFLGELKETIEFLHDPFRKSVDLLKALVSKRNRFRKVKAAAADSWLEFRFGILPLIHDVQDILKLADDKSQKDAVKAFRVYAKAEQSSSSFNYDIGDYLTRYDIEVESYFKSECIIRCGVGFKHESVPGSFSSRLQASIDDISMIPVTAWELVPYSFLVDYFVNVGDIIQSASVGQSAVSFTSNSLIRTCELRYQSTNCRRVQNDMTITSFTPKKVSTFRRDVTRTNTLAAIPPLVFSLPGSKIRYANIAALLVGLTK